VKLGIIIVLALVLLIPAPIFAPSHPEYVGFDLPLKQISHGVSPEAVKCNEGLVLVLKHSGTPACVKPQTAEKFEQRGWGVMPPPCCKNMHEESTEIVISSNDCPIENFLDVTNYDGAGSAYPDPFLNVYCDEKFVYVQSNGIPHYSFVQTTPNALSEQDYLWEIPLNPEISTNTSKIPLLGLIGFSVNGLPIYGPNEGAFPDPYGDPVYNEILDSCLGHTAQRGDYHYHAFELSCLSLNIGNYKESPILGYALDGFPIYGPYGCLDEKCSEIIEFQSSWVKTGDPTTYAWDNYQYVENNSLIYLDQCNGRYDEKLGYHYRATENFPYLLGCYSGEVNSVNIPAVENNQSPQVQNRIPVGCPMPGDPPPREGLPAGCPLPGHPPPPR